MERTERKRKPKPSSINKKNSFLKKHVKISAHQTHSRKRVNSGTKYTAEPEKMKMGKQSASHGILKKPKDVTLQEKSKSVDPSGFSANFVAMDRYGMSGGGENIEKKLSKSSTRSVAKKVSYAKTENDDPDELEEQELPEIKGGGEDISRVRNVETPKSRRWVKGDFDQIEYVSHKNTQRLARSRKREKRGVVSKRHGKVQSKSKERAPSVSTARSSKSRIQTTEYMSPKNISFSSSEAVSSRKTKSVTTRDSSVSTQGLFPFPFKSIERMDSTDYATSRTSSRRAVHSGASNYSEFSSDSSSSDTQQNEVEATTQPNASSSKSLLCLAGRRSSWIPPRSVASALRHEALHKAFMSEKPSENIKPIPPRMSLREFYDYVATQRSFFSPRAPSMIGSYPPQSNNTSPETDINKCSCKNIRTESKSGTLGNASTNERNRIRSVDEQVIPLTDSRGDTSEQKGVRPFVYNKDGRVSLSPSFTYFSTIHTTHKKCRIHNTYTGPLRYQFRFRSPRPCLCRAHPSRRERHRELYSMRQTQQQEQGPPQPQTPRIAQRYSHTFRFKKPLTQESGQPSNYFFIGTESLMAPDRYRGPISRMEQLVYPSGYMVPKNTETLWARNREEALLPRSRKYPRSSNESIANSVEVVSTDDPDSDVAEIRGFGRGGPSLYGLRESTMKWLDQAARK